MEWEDLLTGFDRVRFATQEDNPSILAFFSGIRMMAGGMALGYDRTPDFFAHPRNQSRKHVVALFINDDGTLGGVATLGLNPVYVDGRLQWAGYLTDLRISPAMSRATRRQWRRFYGTFLLHAPALGEDGSSLFVYFAVLDANRDAVRALTGGRSAVASRELARYESVNLLARVPLLWRAGLKEPARHYRVRQASPEDLPALRAFLGRQARGHLFGHAFGEPASDELDRRLAQWDGLRTDSFILAEDRTTGSLAGCMSPWKPGTGRKLVITKLPPLLRFLGAVLPLLGRRRVREGEALEILYLSHLEIGTGLEIRQRRGILALMVAHVFGRGLHRPAHMVSFFDFRNAALAHGLRGYLAQRVPGTLYQAIHRERLEAGLDMARLAEGEVPGFEVGIA
jgi:hypothetical protein